MKRVAPFVGVLLATTLTSAAAPPEWPQFRGPHASGIADESTLPEKWSTKENVAWTIEVPGRGWSSPIVWRGRVFVTSAISPGAFKAPSTGIFGNDYAAELTKQGLPPDEVNRRVINRDIELTDETGEIRYMVYAVDAATGKVVWEREAHRGKPAGGRHRKNTYASETPVTDGERVYVSFGGNVGLFCLLDGRHLPVAAHLAAAADLPRFRHGIVAGRAPGTGLSAARQRRRVVSCRDGREERQGALERASAPGSPAR